ncbi:glyceraldehyde-3-phosphate dehydrogenase [Sorangium cellulosum]|uniref:Glyceraldehyde-3-phosphate dehydrogenase n=2 Tax=Sorangium cellulosum TaxID=56 RepID=A0A150PIR3_SORCE|nr:type I glyceraldehyde-3-phosphate dehydrogenase [Sorangium cellulosum]AGP32601.1 glyceraldehyde-3-phosphate dehydrogenase [Sorangium cellulosum So0157-2]KYF55318.1 glyceraldehyde-3-phosphate dehydrogenase [Sorangium cellulosum]
MSKRIAINGFGRIGRCIVRALSQRGVSDIELSALNDMASPETLAHLYNYDTVHGRAERRAVAADGRLLIDERPVRVLAEKDPAKLPWRELGVDIVLECTGVFTDRDKAAAHLAAGARKVIIGAPAKGHDATIVLGVNTEEYDGSAHTVLSCGSCTTNCLAPVAKVLLDAFGLERGLMTTTHAYTNDQVLLDVPHRKGDLRRARAAAQNIVPTSSGAAKALSECLPALAGRFDGLSMRVPTMDVSVVDLTFESTRPLTKDAIHAAMKRASEGPLRGILGYTEEPLVSSDYLGDPRSSIFDATLTQVMGDRFAKVFAWYDNEWGFSNRMVELAQLVAAKL